MEDKEINYSKEEEQKSLLPFLEEEEKEDKAHRFSNVEKQWEGENNELFDNSQKTNINVASNLVAGNSTVQGLNDNPSE